VPATNQADDIYTADGTLTGNREVALATYDIGFTGGNVGIGTASPAVKLHIKDSSSNARMYFEDGSNSISEINGGSYGAGGNSKISFRTQENGDPLTTKMVIIDNGNIGIGMTTPGAKLDIKGAGTTSATTSLLAKNSSGGELFKVYDSGQVAINGGGVVDNTSPIGVGIKMNSANESTLFITSNFNYDSHNSAIAVVDNTSQHERLFYGSFPSNTNAINDQTGRGFVYNAGVASGSADTGGGGYYSKAQNVGNTTITGDVINFMAHTYVQGSGGTETVNNAYGFRSKPQLGAATANIVNMYDFFTTPVTGSANGTITNRYGLYLDHDSAGVTNAWGVYQAKSDVKNYFAGNVGIGTTTPGAKLHVYNPTLDNTAGKTTLYLTENNSDESHGGLDTAKPYYGIGFKRL